MLHYLSGNRQIDNFPTIMKLKIPPVVIFLTSFGLIKLIHHLTLNLEITFPLNSFTAYVFIGLGFVIGLLGVVEFSRHKTTVDPAHPEKASSIVTSGVYRFTRNPMYLGMAIGLIGIIIHYGNLVGSLALLFFIWYLTEYQIKPEEQILKRNFGKPYEAYLQKVRRWV